MSVQATHSKRSYERTLMEPNGRGKRQKYGANRTNDSPSKESTGLRVLCPAASLNEDNDSVISQISRESGAAVRAEEMAPGCDERIIIITGRDKDNVGDDQSREEQTNATEGEDGKGDDKRDEEKDSDVALSENRIASLQKALLLVFERIASGESGKDGGDVESDMTSSFVLRLLVLSNQVGCLLGKGGSTIKQMSSESGAQIRVLPRDKLPSCASSSEELVQVSGELGAVKKALRSVSQQLLEGPARDHDSLTNNHSGPSSHFSGHSRADAYPQSNHHFPAQGPPFNAGYRDADVVPGRMNQSQDILTFRLVCHDEKVGGVIGRGGSIIKSLQHETGCEIKVQEAMADSPDRIITISGQAHPDERVSAPQDAVLRVQSRIVRAMPESKEKTVTAKLLVSSYQIGCLLGKGGSIIAEMRKSTGAYIRILGKDQIPKGASENEEVVQINGEYEAVEEALLQITSRLQNHFFRDVFPSINHPLRPGFPDQVAQFPPYPGRRELSPPGMYSNIGPSFHKFDAAGGRPPHGFHPHDDRPPFMPNFHRPGIPPHISERMPPSAPWGPQGMKGGGAMGLSDYAGAPPRRIGGFGGGSHPAIITNTTVEVVVPRTAVPAIYGEDGGCLKQIREISDAKITITDPKPGATETIIIISGTPEQTHAAQSLIQAFVISETEAP